MTEYIENPNASPSPPPMLLNSVIPSTRYDFVIVFTIPLEGYFIVTKVVEFKSKLAFMASIEMAKILLLTNSSMLFRLIICFLRTFVLFRWHLSVNCKLKKNSPQYKILLNTNLDIFCTGACLLQKTSRSTSPMWMFYFWTPHRLCMPYSQLSPCPMTVPMVNCTLVRKIQMHHFWNQMNSFLTVCILKATPKIK